MLVTVLASTQLHDLPGMEPDGNASDAETLIEFAGRLCYKSFDKPNEKTRANKDYIANIIKQQHYSVLEHGSVTFLVQAVSRSLTHELVRHRHLSFSQLSQRYVNQARIGSVVPPVVHELLDDETFDLLSDDMNALFSESRDVYVAIEDALIEAGANKKEARGAARAVLLESTTTEIVVTGNHRSWREFIQKRNSPHADAEIRELSGQILDHLSDLAPSIYADLVGEETA